MDTIYEEYCMTPRVPNFSILQSFVERWSPRAFDDEYVLDESQLHILFEAARWAPSSFNIQPWLYVYSLRGEAAWNRILQALIPFNRLWAGNASALICVCSQKDAPTKRGERAPSYSHSFDAGASWAHLALQAHEIGLHTHAMTGFDPQALGFAIEVPANVRIEAVVAVGKRGSPEKLPVELRSRETPSDRKPITEFVLKDSFPQPNGRV